MSSKLKNPLAPKRYLTNAYDNVFYTISSTTNSLSTSQFVSSDICLDQFMKITYLNKKNTQS